MFHKMSTKSQGSKKTSKESKLLDVLMAAKALSHLGSDEEHSENGDNEDDSKSQPKKASNEAVVPKKEAPAEGSGEEEGTPTAIKTFPEKLMDMLDNEDVQDAITWLPGGKSFSIINPNKFTDNVLPRFFKQAKFESFVRKLYRWGFRQVDKGEIGHITFYHKNFQKGNIALAVAKLRSVTPSKLSNAANKAAKERFVTDPSCHSNMNAMNPNCMNTGVNFGDRLPASTQSLLAQLRKDRGYDLKSGLPHPHMGGLQDMMSIPPGFHGYPGAPGFGGRSSLGSSMATRLLLRQQEMAAKMAAANSYGAALGGAGDSAGSASSTAQAILAKQKMAQIQAAAMQTQMRMQAAARWQTQQSQLRQVLDGQTAQQQQQKLAELRMGMGSHGGVNHAANLANLMKPLSGSARMQLDAAKQVMYQTLHAAQPSYGQDIVKAAVDALNNAP